MFAKLQHRWGLRSGWQVLAVLLVFSLAGMSILPVRKLIFHLLHFDGQTPMWLKTVVWLLVVFPAYQLFLLLYGSLFGQFRFFWEKEKKMGRWLRRRFAAPEQKETRA
ncbi:MAG TPA: hypothetical protein PKE12_05895 [Kiritimatiellia bacterium]|nr:hypothetical protein [Kiritimatiellia bacterium]